MIWLILFGIVGYVIYHFSKDRNDMLVRQVDLHGGMAIKYKYLIDCLTKETFAKTIKITRNHIHIRATLPTTSTDFFITEIFNEVNIEWIVNLGYLGTHKNTWRFVHNYPQDKMIEQINEYINWKSNQIFGL